MFIPSVQFNRLIESMPMRAEAVLVARHLTITFGNSSCNSIPLLPVCTYIHVRESLSFGQILHDVQNVRNQLEYVEKVYLFEYVEQNPQIHDTEYEKMLRA